MFKITQVQFQKENPNRFNIFLDGKFAFAADEDTLVNLHLFKGKQLSSEDLENILSETKIGRWMENMYRLFSIRQRSEKEIRDYFESKQSQSKIKGKESISKALIDKVIDRLKQKGLIDDEEFAKAWVDARRRSRKKGKFALKQELFQKGIAKEIIEEAISDQSSDVREEQVAEAAINKKLKSWTLLPYLGKKKKAYDFLMRRGFEYKVVKVVVEKLLKKE